MAPPSPLEIPFDFNKAAQLSRNVASASYIPNTITTFTTNASQWEPGEFSNGINSFGPDQNVFILHNSGSNQGANQRYAYIAFATQVPVTLSSLSFSAQTNGPIPTTPMFSVESSPIANFAIDVKLLGQANGPTGPWTDSNVAFAPFEVQAGSIIYIRIRVSSAIPDGSNYVAYKDVKLVGIVTGGGPPPGQPLELLYDFNTANELALNVASSQSVFGVDSVASTNALQWEPGEFSNGVTSFGPNDNVFIIHDAGPESGDNQRYLFVALATQQPVVLTQLQVNVGSNAHGNSPTNPVTIAVEASTTSGFSTPVTLGTVSTTTNTLALNLPIPRGLTYLRLRSTFPIPDGSNYIAYDHLKLNGTLVV